MSFDFDPLYCVLRLRPRSPPILAAEAPTCSHNTTDYRSRVNRRLDIAGKGGGPREGAGPAAAGGRPGRRWRASLPSRLAQPPRLQSGIKVAPARAAACRIGLVVFVGVLLGRRRSPCAAVSRGGRRRRPCPARRRCWFSASAATCRVRRAASDAIDIIVRSLRAGYPVPVAIAMVARELPDPVGTEFGMVADEVTYGADIETALRNMMRAGRTGGSRRSSLRPCIPSTDGRQPRARSWTTSPRSSASASRCGARSRALSAEGRAGR